MKRVFQVLLKLLIAAGILALVLHRAQSAKIWANLESLGFGALLLALALVVVAHLLTAARMRVFVKAYGIALPLPYACKLYFVGTLFNLILPTGVGGDAVKAWALKKMYDTPLAPVIKALILDRASGLYVLCLIVLSGVLFLGGAIPLAWLAWLGLPVVTVSYFILASVLFGQRPRDGIRALGYSLASQGLWCAVILVLYRASGDGGSALSYVLLYAAAAVVSMLPITIGGLGLREMTFYYGAAWLSGHAGLSVDPERAVAISLAYFALYVVSSLPGLLWIAALLPKKPVKG